MDSERFIGDSAITDGVQVRHQDVSLDVVYCDRGPESGAAGVLYIREDVDVVLSGLRKKRHPGPGLAGLCGACSTQGIGAGNSSHVAISFGQQTRDNDLGHWEACL